MARHQEGHAVARPQAETGQRTAEQGGPAEPGQGGAQGGGQLDVFPELTCVSQPWCQLRKVTKENSGRLQAGRGGLGRLWLAPGAVNLARHCVLQSAPGSDALQMTPDCLRERCLALVVHVQHSVLWHEGVILLPFVWHSRRQRRDVPVQVSVTLLAA